VTGKSTAPLVPLVRKVFATELVPFSNAGVWELLPVENGEPEWFWVYDAGAL
jgi:hypothetical protein